MKISELRYGDNFVGRDYEIQELKTKIRNNGLVVVTGDRGIGKTSLMIILNNFFEREKECYSIEYGSLFSEEMSRIFLPEQITTGFSSSISLLGVGSGAGKSWKPRERSILEYMEQSKEKIIFIENAQELMKTEIEIILVAIRRNEHLKFVLEIATPYMPDINLKINSDQVIELKELNNNDIEKIVKKEFSNFSEPVVRKMISLSKGNPYVARSLAYICNEKNEENSMLGFLNTLRDDSLRYNINQIHKEILKILKEDSQELIRKLAIAPPILTLKLMEAFYDKGIDAPLNDIIERGILKNKKKFYWIYHPLFRDYLRHEQRVALTNKGRIYSEAMERVKSEVDSFYILFETLNDPNISEALIEIAENYDAIYEIGIQSYIWGELDKSNFAWSRIIEISKESKNKRWESIAMGQIGMIYKTKGDLDRSIEYYKRALELNEELGRKEGIAGNYSAMSNIYRVKGELDKALKYCEKALELNEELGNKEGIAIDCNAIATVYQIKEEHDKAIEFYEKSLKLDEELGRKEGMSITYGNMGNIFIIKRKLDKALEYCEKSLKLSEELGFKEGLSQNYGNLGNIYKNKGELDKALGYYEKSLKLNEKLENKLGIGSDYGDMANIYREKGEFDKAIEYCEKGVKLYEDVKGKEGMIPGYVIMGSIYEKKGEFNKAIEYYEKALKLNEELGRKKGVARNYCRIGNAYLHKVELEKAIESYEKALKLNEELDRKVSIAGNYGKIGLIYKIKGELDKAIECYEKASKLNEELGKKEELAENYGFTGEIYFNNREFDKAIGFFEKSLNLYENLGNRNGMFLNYGSIGQSYRMKGDFDKALWYFEKTIAIFREMGIDEQESQNDHEAQTLMEMGVIFLEKGENERALNVYLEAQGLAMDRPFIFREISRMINRECNRFC
ncbi:Photosystem I assembly protein Ycf3 [uncultured archaeon]|nr:Photosystem I assembly protein Ycf3 [uncultured archaeon]